MPTAGAILSERRLESCKVLVPFREIEDTMKLSIEAELVYNFANDTQVIANLEASRTSDQLILSESLDIRPPTQNSFRHHSLGDRRIRASLSGEVTIRYTAVVENNLRQLLPPSGRQQCGPTFQARFYRFCCPAASVPPTSSCGSRSVSSGAQATGSLRSWRYWSGSTATSITSLA